MKGKKGFPGGSVVKNPSAVQEMGVRSLGQEDPLEKDMATHSSILTCRIPWAEQPGGLQSMRSQRVRNDLSGLSRVHMDCHGISWVSSVLMRRL